MPRPDRESQVDDKTRIVKTTELREAIAAGAIDVGPVTDHSDVIVDVRDLRDPVDCGSMLTALRKGESTLALSELYDANVDLLEHGGIIKQYAGDFVDHALVRRKELTLRAANGDRFAQAILDGDSLAEDPVD